MRASSPGPSRSPPSRVVLAACGQSGGSDAAATVNGTDIPRELVERIVVAQLEGPQVPPRATSGPTSRASPAQRAVDPHRRRDRRAARRRGGIEVDDAELDEAYDEQVALYEESGRDVGSADPSSPRSSRPSGSTEDEYRDIIVADLVRRDALTAEFGEEITDERSRPPTTSRPNRRSTPATSWSRPRRRPTT